MMTMFNLDYFSLLGSSSTNLGSIDWQSLDNERRLERGKFNM